MTRDDFEIMAPVGSEESLAAALRAGANSIYFGIEGLNMRAHSSSNFTLDDLRHIAALCDKCGVKTYLTVNTVIYDNDLDKMRSIIDTAKEAGISAIIACDVAAMTYARSVGVEVHLSTQLNISNVEALRFYAQFADVVVLARELNVDQTRAIYDAIRREHICGPSGAPVRIEMFCHGALCMAISGKCYLSLHEHWKSANRGECLQVCRRAYDAREHLDPADTRKAEPIELTIDDQYIFSPKDLKTIHFLNRLLDSGVRVLKIEGRARGPEYVKTVVECYDEAIRAYLDGDYGRADLINDKIKRWDQRLATVFNRGFWNGYYLGQRLGEWTATPGSQATLRKVYAGKCTNYFSRLGVAEFLLEAAPVHKGDQLLATGATTGAYEFLASDLRKGDKGVKCDVATQGEYISLKTERKIHRGDRLFLLQSTLT